MDLKEFLLWEQATRDCIDVKKIYVDMADDLIAGILLSQIVYWFLPDKKGKTKLRIEKEGHLWLAKGREDWWDECRIKPRQFDTAFKKLEEQELVEKRTFKFDGDPTIHIRILWDKFLPRLQELLYLFESSTQEEENQKNLDNSGFHESVKTELQFGEIVLSKSVKTITENIDKDLKEREREEIHIPSVSKKELLSFESQIEILEKDFKALKEITKYVFGMPKAEQIDLESIWNHWHNRFPQYDLTHIYAVMRATQISAKPKDDITGIIIKRLPHANKALVPVKQLAIDYVAQIRRA